MAKISDNDRADNCPTFSNLTQFIFPPLEKVMTPRTDRGTVQVDLKMLKFPQLLDEKLSIKLKFKVTSRTNEPTKYFHMKSPFVEGRDHQRQEIGCVISESLNFA